MSKLISIPVLNLASFNVVLERVCMHSRYISLIKNSEICYLHIVTFILPNLRVSAVNWNIHKLQTKIVFISIYTNKVSIQATCLLAVQWSFLMRIQCLMMIHSVLLTFCISKKRILKIGVYLFVCLKPTRTGDAKQN